LKQRQVDEGLQKINGGEINRNNDRHMADMINWEDILGIRTIDNRRNRRVVLGVMHVGPDLIDVERKQVRGLAGSIPISIELKNCLDILERMAS
jgi:hypothetical protein